MELIAEIFTEIFIRSWSAWRLDISEPDFGMVVCGCSVSDRKCHTGKSAMARKNSIT